MTQDELDLFAGWLIQEGIADVFMDRVDYNRRTKNPASVIDMLVSWADTTEGYAYWSGKDRAWRDYYEEVCKHDKRAVR
jgi:hypothetical protein